MSLCSCVITLNKLNQQYMQSTNDLLICYVVACWALYNAFTLTLSAFFEAEPFILRGISAALFRLVKVKHVTTVSGMWEIWLHHKYRTKQTTVQNITWIWMQGGKIYSHRDSRMASSYYCTIYLLNVVLSLSVLGIYELTSMIFCRYSKLSRGRLTPFCLWSMFLNSRHQPIIRFNYLIRC